MIVEPARKSSRSKPFRRKSFWDSTVVSADGWEYRTCKKGGGGFKLHWVEYRDAVGSVFVCIDTDNMNEYVRGICAQSLRLESEQGPPLTDKMRADLVIRRLCEYYSYYDARYVVMLDR